MATCTLTYTVNNLKKKKVLEGLKGKYISEIKMKCIIIYLFLTEP